MEEPNTATTASPPHAGHQPAHTAVGWHPILQPAFVSSEPIGVFTPEYFGVLFPQ